jgi:hypothetical protein
VARRHQQCTASHLVFLCNQSSYAQRSLFPDELSKRNRTEPGNQRRHLLCSFEFNRGKLVYTHYLSALMMNSRKPDARSLGKSATKRCGLFTGTPDQLSRLGAIPQHSTFTKLYLMFVEVDQPEGFPTAGFDGAVDCGVVDGVGGLSGEEDDGFAGHVGQRVRQDGLVADSGVLETCTLVRVGASEVVI